MAREKADFTKLTGTVIGKGVTIHAAQITGSDSIRVEGTVYGTIDLEGTLHLSDNAYVEGDVRVTSALIAGQVKGNVVCRSTLHMASTSIIKGDITTAAFIVDEGAVLNGICRTHSSEPAPSLSVI